MKRARHQGYVVSRDRMNPCWPTHACPPRFWEELGRTIAAFGFLEDCLKRANLAVTATREYGSVNEAEEAFGTWERDLERSLDESLGDLTKRFIRALSEDERFVKNYVTGIEYRLKKAADWRNALCHGAWTDYDCDSDRATLRYWPRKGWREHSERPISVVDLAAIRSEAIDITVNVINTVTSNGFEFPGSASPGEPVLSSRSE